MAVRLLQCPSVTLDDLHEQLAASSSGGASQRSAKGDVQSTEEVGTGTPAQPQSEAAAKPDEAQEQAPEPAPQLKPIDAGATQELLQLLSGDLTAAAGTTTRVLSLIEQRADCAARTDTEVSSHVGSVGI